MTTTLCTDQSYPPKEVFFLGAGTSVSGGSPTFANFRNKAKDVLSKMLENRELNSTKISLFQDVLTQWDKDFSDYNIEEYYSAIEMNEQLNREDESTTEEIAKFIALTIQKSIDTSSTPSYELLAAYGVTKAIITTNWDILLERSIRKSLGTDAFSYGNGIQPYGKITQPQSPGSTRYVIPILKLHGSLNWGFCKKCGQIHCFGEKIYVQLVSNNGKKCGKHDDVRLTPLIVPPTLSKLERAETREENSPYVPLRSIWSKASEYLGLCEKVYFIGYSFPETDVQMKIFISNALRKNKNLKEVNIVSNSKYGKSRVDFEERYSPILLKIKNNPKIIFNYDGFEKFCEEQLRKVKGRCEVVS